ncbi:MAG: hypothetical protein RLZZ271_1409 [Pseudomonadota bacterium]
MRASDSIRPRLPRFGVVDKCDSTIAGDIKNIFPLFRSSITDKVFSNSWTVGDVLAHRIKCETNLNVMWCLWRERKRPPPIFETVTIAFWYFKPSNLTVKVHYLGLRK